MIVKHANRLDKQIKELFERYEAGTASEKEIKLVENWFSRFDNEKPALSDEKYAAIFKQMDEEMLGEVPQPKVRRLIINRWLQAAAVLLFAGIGVLLYRANHKIPANQVTYTTISTKYGEKRMCRLADGTDVYLNAGSVLHIPSTYGDHNRQVELTGEGYFVVKHDAAKPFFINTGKIVVTDIGTAFNVKSYANDRRIKVTVESGIVRVDKQLNGAGKPETYAKALIADQQFIYNKEDGQYTLNRLPAGPSTAWHNNQLVFENASFTEIAHTLERWYNVSVTLQNSAMNSHHYTVGFNNEPVGNVLAVLKKLSGINYQINDRNISINLKTTSK